MLNLVGKNLSVAAPVSTLKKMGHINGTESIQAFFEQMLSKVSKIATSEQRSAIDEYRPYLCNSPLAPIVLKNMVEQNLNFSDALAASSSEIQLTSMQLRAVFGMINIIPGVSEMINSVLDDIVNSLNGYAGDSESEDISFALKEVSFDFCIAIGKIGIIDVIQKVSDMEKVSTAIEQKISTPLLSAAIKAVLGEEKISMDELDKDEMAELQEIVNQSTSEVAAIYPAQLVLSTVFTKAINDDITVAEAMATFDANQLVEEIAEKIVSSDGLSKYADQLEKVMAIACKLA